MGDRLRRGGCRDKSRREQRFANRCHLHFSLPLAFDLDSFGTAYYGSAIKRRASGNGMQQSLTESLPADQQGGHFRSEASSGGIECVSTCRFRRSPYVYKKNNKTRIIKRRTI